jgi:DNA-binding response OmpR family regulator
MLASLVDCLEDHGFVVSTASDGGEALDRMPRSRRRDSAGCPHARSWVGSPASRPRQHSSTDLPVIMLSVEDDIGTIVGALDLGANDYLRSPPR